MLNNDLFLSEKTVNNINSISKSDAPLLILGESGVGKEIVANRVHKLSNRNKNEPIIINIAALPADLIEKELFGAVKGAFTGAETDSIGKFELANHSTLILDEIGELPLVIQGKLLRVIESGIIEPVGSNRSLKVDCRIIAVTNKNLEELISKGQFRNDLLYRLNVITLNIPPLRERITEIPKITQLFLNEFSKYKNEITISNEAMNKLISYDWPGNIRELKNTIERAITLSNNREITSEYLLLSSDNNVNIASTTLKEAMTIFKRRYITQVLESNGWNVTKSAKVLDIQRTYLSRLIKELYNE